MPIIPRITQILNVIPVDRLNTTTEIEARFGRFGKTDERGKKKLDSKIHPSIYTRIRDYIESREIGSDYVEFVDHKWTNGLRRRITTKGTKLDEWVYKDRIDHPDLDNGNLDLYEYNIRISISTEELTDPYTPEELEELGDPVVIRHIRRHSLQIGNSRIDLSRVEMTLKGDLHVNHELEVELTEPPTPDSLAQFNDVIEQVFKIAYWTDNIYTVSEVRDLNFNLNMILSNETEKHGNFVNRKYFNDGRNLQMNDLVHGGIVGNRDGIYFVTDKADGIRKILVFSKTGMWIVFPSFEYNLIHRHPGYEKLKDIILEGEYIPVETRKRRDDGSFLNQFHDRSHVMYIFDCLSFYKLKGTIRRASHAKRMEAAGQIVERLDKPMIYLEVKSFQGLNEENFFARMNETLDGLNTLPYENDGLMIIPDFAPYDPWQGRDKPPAYKRSLTRFADICKWKPSSNLTIDLRIKMGRNGTVALYTSGKGKQDEEWFGTLYNPLKWENGVDPNDPLLNQNGFVPTGTIVEFAYRSKNGPKDGPKDGPKPENEFQLKAIKIRHDKQNPNTVDVVNDTWDLAHRPVEEKTLRGEGTLLMRRYHNRIKRELFRSMRQGSSVLDIGSGNGGDIDKWPGLSHIVAVEPDPDHRKEFMRRFEQSLTHKRGITKVELLGTGGEDVETITRAVQDFVPGGKVDYIVMMLSLTFFWRDIEMLERLADVILNNLKPDGHVIFLTMDGDSVEQSFKPAMGGAVLDRLELGEVTIEMIDRNPKPGHGQKIKITIPDSIVGEQTEYLAKLDDLATLVGGTLSKESATQETFLNPNEKVLTSLYSYGAITNIDTKKITRRRNKMSRPGSDEIIEPGSGSDETDPLSDEPNVVFVEGECIKDGPCDSGECGAGVPEPEPIPIDPGRRLGMLGGRRTMIERINSSWADASLFRYNTVGDGNCLYHSFLNAVSEKYNDISNNYNARDARLEKTFAAESLRWDIGARVKEPMFEHSNYSYWTLINKGQFPIQYFMELALYQQACDARLRDPVTPFRANEDEFGEPRVIRTFDFDYSEDGAVAAIQKGGHYSGQELIIFLSEITGVDINLYQPWENEVIPQFTTMREGKERDVVMIASVPGHYETMAVATTFLTDEGKKFHGLQTVFDHDDSLFDSIERLPAINEDTLVEDTENNFVDQTGPTLLALKNDDSSFSVFKRLWPGFSQSFQELLTLAFVSNDIPIPTEQDWESEPTCFKSQLMMARDLNIDLPGTTPTTPAGRGRTATGRRPVISRRQTREEAQLEQAIQESLVSATEGTEDTERAEAASSGGVEENRVPPVLRSTGGRRRIRDREAEELERAIEESTRTGDRDRETEEIQEATRRSTERESAVGTSRTLPARRGGRLASRSSNV